MRKEAAQSIKRPWLRKETAVEEKSHAVEEKGSLTEERILIGRLQSKIKRKGQRGWGRLICQLQKKGRFSKKQFER